MLPSPLRASSWRMSPAPPFSSLEGVSAADAVSDDWLSCFDFSDLLPAPSTPADLPEITDVDCFDISDLLASEENRPSFDLLEENPPFFIPSEGFSSISEPDKVDRAVHRCEAATPSLRNSSTVSSPHNSDAGSSMAAADSSLKQGMNKGLENYGYAMKTFATYSIASSHKRQHDDIGSDMEGGDGEGKSQLDPLDKKQQRLLRNRELAFESRQRKKCYVRDLEAKCKMLEQERNQLQQQVCFSAAENAVLKEELARMKKKKGGDGVAEPAVLFKDSLPLEFLSLLICLLLMARLSLCVSPFVALVLRAIVCPQSAIKAEGLLKQQVGSKRSFHSIIYNIRWSFNHLWFHKPLRDCELSIICA